MKYYIDFHTATARDISSLYFQLHLLLINNVNNVDNLAVAFPRYTPKNENKKGKIGSVIRLFSPTKEALENINIYGDLISPDAEISVSGILPVPDEVICHAVFRRSKRRTESHFRRIAKRSVSFGNASTEDEVFDSIKKNNISKGNSDPSISLKSHSTKQRFPLHISITPSLNPKAGTFCSYGLSQGATVPIF